MRAALLVLVLASAAHADEVRPAPAEWTAWVGVGGGARDLGSAGSRGVFVARAGGGVSLEVARLWSPGYGGAYELRWGPWLGAETQLDGALGEAGLELIFTQTAHARWGTFALRLGGGYGGDAEGSGALASLTITGGVRSVPGRHLGPGRTPAAPPRAHRWASGVRLFVTLRVPADPERGATLVGGLELEPSFLLPPHTVTKWIGAAP